MSPTQKRAFGIASTRPRCAPCFGGALTAPADEPSSEIVVANFQPVQFQDRNRERPSAGWTSQIESITRAVGLFFFGGDTWVCNDYYGSAIRLVTASARFYAVFDLHDTLQSSR